MGPELGRSVKAILRTGTARYRGMVGTGGIGSGSFFLLAGNETLGREESRAGRFLARKDSCKLHIVSHYVKALLGDAMGVFPIGRVGEDQAGAGLLLEMRDAGLDLRYVRAIPGASTLFSFCLLYPDGSGGNLTTEDSASSRLGPGDLEEAVDLMSGLGREGIAVALPEVPLSVRSALLRLASEHGLLRAASFARGEMEEVRALGILDTVDLLAVNAEEAFAAAGRPSAAVDARSIEIAVEALSVAYPRLLLSVTAGAAGSWSWDTKVLRHCPALSVEVRGTAGAGDAHLAGTLCGLAAGLSLADAQGLGTLLAGAAVTSPDAINREITREALRALSAGRGSLSHCALLLT